MHLIPHVHRWGFPGQGERHPQSTVTLCVIPRPQGRCSQRFPIFVLTHWRKENGPHVKM